MGLVITTICVPVDDYLDMMQKLEDRRALMSALVSIIDAETARNREDAETATIAKDALDRCNRQ